MSDDFDLDLDNAIPAEPCADASPEVEEVFSAPAQPPQPPARDNKKRNRMIAIIAVALVVIIAAGAVAAPAIIKAVNPKAAVAAALVKTMDNAGFDDAAAIAADLQKGAFEQTLFLRLGEEMPAAISDSLSQALSIAPDQLSGTGFSLLVQTDRAQRKAALSFGLDLGVYHAGDIQAFFDNNILSIGSPQLTDRKFYCVNTETLGADWHANEFWREVEGVPQDLSFNVFEVVEDATGKDSTAALLTLNKASTMTKDGGGAYTLTIPADALRDYLRTTLSAAAVPDADDIADLFQSDATVLFIVKKGAVNWMEVILPMTADGEKLFLRFTMEQDETGALTFALTGDDDSSNGAFTLTASPTVSADKSAKQMGVDLPNLTLTTGGETLVLGMGLTMAPLEEFAFQPESPVALMELDQNGVLELLFGALGGIQKITEEMSTGY